MFFQTKIISMMSGTIRNIYITSSRYVFCLSEGVLLWVLAVAGHIFDKLYSPRKYGKSKKAQSTWLMSENSEKSHFDEVEAIDEELSVNDDTVFSIRRCKTWFSSNVLHSDNPNEMDEEDVIRFCQVINKDLEDVVLLVLAYKMNATRVGFFTLDEWLTGMKDLEIDTHAKLLAKWEWLRSLLDDKTFRRSVYRFSFKFSRSQDRRNLETYLGQGLIRIFFENRWALMDDFIQFLSSTKRTIMTYDEFCSVFEFQEHIHDDLGNYDFEGAWPILLDDFVVHMRQKTNAERNASRAVRQ